MTITVVTKDANNPEKWEKVNLEENPFTNIAKEGETIPIDDVIDFIAYPYYERGSEFRKVQKFCLHTTIDNYRDIRYYYNEGQN